MNLQYQIQLHTWWHCGSGQSAGADVDTLVIKDSNGMPFIPGKTIKGLLRDAVEELLCWQESNDGQTKVAEDSPFGKLFGNFDNDKDAMCQAESFFTDAVLPQNEYDTIVARQLQHYLFHSIASTAIEADGIAKNNSLRKIEVVAPCTLTGEVLNVPAKIVDLLGDAMSYVKNLGSGRNRGLGRCTFSVLPDDPQTNSTTDETRQTMQFKVTLLSDIVLQQTSATTGSSKTLDFIPGANFMGIVAGKLYKELGECPETYELFHSGKVHFGDANPAHDGHRCCRVPLAMFHPKFEKETESCYIHHAIQDFDEVSSLQLKQCRSGYYDFTDLAHAQAVKTEKEIALKSARDKNTRSSAKGQMFCYESLEKGTEMLMQVEAPTAELRKKISACLIGTHRVGRSRSAQYGLVQIEETKYETPHCTPNAKNADVVIYADSRLVFLDEFGIPTCQPEPSDFGIKAKEAKIDWTRSQVRSFCYAPWNFQRQCFDAERFGIEKGSVIIITGAEEEVSGPRCVGDFCTEGFGQVLLNPDFLLSQTGTNGRSKASLIPDTLTHQITDSSADTPLIHWLEDKEHQEQLDYELYEQINNWVIRQRNTFCSEQLKSQWGQIRALAMEGGTKDEIVSRIAEYLGHGVASKRWSKFSRSQVLIDFLRDTFDDENIQMTIINLASQMAKLK